MHLHQRACMHACMYPRRATCRCTCCRCSCWLCCRLLANIGCILLKQQKPQEALKAFKAALDNIPLTAKDQVNYSLTSLCMRCSLWVPLACVCCCCLHAFVAAICMHLLLPLACVRCCILHIIVVAVCMRLLLVFACVCCGCCCILAAVVRIQLRARVACAVAAVLCMPHSIFTP